MATVQPMDRAERDDLAWRLRYAINDMAIRYGRSQNQAGLSIGRADSATIYRYERAADRQLAALMRLTRCLRELAVAS